MPALNTQRLPARIKQQGFTLIELVVVLVIIAVMTGLVLTNLSGRDDSDALERDAQRLSSVLSLLQDEAIVQSREFGVQMFDRGYRFFIFNNEGAWLPLDDATTFRPFILSHGVSAELILEGDVVDLPKLGKNGFPSAAPVAEGQSVNPEQQPSLFVFSSGELSTYELWLRSSRSKTFYKLTGNIVGQFGYEFGQSE